MRVRKSGSWHWTPRVPDSASTLQRQVEARERAAGSRPQGHDPLKSNKEIVSEIVFRYTHEVSNFSPRWIIINAMNSEMFNVKLKRPVAGYPDYQQYSCNDNFCSQDRYKDFEGG